MSKFCSDSRNNGDKNGYMDQNLDIDWENLGFGITPTDYMYVTKCLRDEEFSDGLLIPYGNIEMSPGAGVLNYGQGLYEGMKVMRREDGKIVMFRTNENAKRLQIGAQRMCMPAPSVDLFLDAVNQTALANKRWIPPAGKGCLYLRPLLLGTGPVLGLAPAPEYTFIIFASPVSNYFKEGSAPLNLYVEDEYHRASRGGTGGVKSITNYSPALKPLTRAKSRGYSDILYLDSVHKKYVEEVTACNVFIVKDNVISTPSATGSILPGVTRKSIIEIARDHGFQVEERLIEVEELLEADEVFCTGTAVVVVPVGSVTYQGKRVEYKTDAETISKQLLSIYMGIQNGELEDKYRWMVEIN